MAAYDGREDRTCGKTELVGKESEQITKPPAYSVLYFISVQHMQRHFLSCTAFAPISHPSCAIAPAYRSVREEGGHIPDQPAVWRWASSTLLLSHFTGLEFLCMLVNILGLLKTTLNHDSFGQAFITRVEMKTFLFSMVIRSAFVYHPLLS